MALPSRRSSRLLAVAVVFCSAAGAEAAASQAIAAVSLVSASTQGPAPLMVEVRKALDVGMFFALLACSLA
jgi:hypothetical protein